MRTRTPIAHLFANLIALGLTVAGLTVGSMARADDQRTSAVFSISIRGLSAATLTLNGAAMGQRYQASGTLKSAGLLGLVKTIRYDAKVEGRRIADRAVPVRYSETADTGKRQSAAVMAYKAGVPQVKSYVPPRPPRVDDIDPATQGGTVDPLTALYLILRDVPAAKACAMKLTLFDGRRRSQIMLGKPAKSGDQITCAGEYRRLDGFTPEDMAEKNRFALSLTYGQSAKDMVHVTEISMDTLYGKGRMIRQ